MAAQQSPSAHIAHQQHYPPHVRPQPNGAMPIPQQVVAAPPPQQPPPPQQYQLGQLAACNEKIWLQLGALSEQLGELEGASQAYERSLSFNPYSVPTMMAISSLLRSQDQFSRASEVLRQILKIENNNGEVWSNLGHCYLMIDDLQQAYSAYQQALYHLPDPKEPKLWYGIGILYDRYGSLEHAEEAFSQVMRMEPNFEKANEIYFRLGIIYKQQQKYPMSLECFHYIVTDPPRPLSEEDIWFQIGHVHEQQKDYEHAKAAYTRVLERDANHAKVLQQLGWLHHQQSTSFSSQEQAIEYLEKSVGSDQTDAQSWYLLGRCYMSQQKYPKAYEAYQQAVYRDGRNPTFWCSIGVLYYQINQYRDALDAYSRAIRLNPNISEVWYDLGTLYESCNNQQSDALDAYSRAADLDPSNEHIKARLALLKGQPTNGMPNQGNAPLPQDVHPQAYQPNAISGPPGVQWGAHSQNPPPGPAPPPLAAGANWGGSRPGELQGPPAMPPQPINPYDQRDRGLPPGPQPGPPRAPSPPRQQAGRQYQEQPQRPPPPSHRGLSPSPKGHPPAPYQPGPPHQHQALPPHPQPPPHPGYAHPPNAGPSNGLYPGVPPQHLRQSEAPVEVRPLVSQAAPSPGGHYHRGPYEHHPNAAPSIASGAPPPSAAQTAADAAVREREERPASVAPKRPREWDDESNVNVKKATTEEGRARLDDIKVQRQSPTPRQMDTPPRPASAYKPSNAAHHHPPPLPPMQQSMAGPSPRNSAAPREEYRAPPPSTPAPGGSSTPAPPAQAVLEPAARKMDVDENYDDSGDERSGPVPKQESQKNSPRVASAAGSANGDGKA